MKRFILAALLLVVGGCEQPQEIGMSSVYTPVTNNNPATITLPSPGDLVAAAVVNQAWKDLADRDAYAIAFADIASQTGAVVGSKVYVKGFGWWTYLTAAPFGVDSFWEITATGMGVGHWEHELLATINLQKMPSVGPVPGEVFTFATPAGRINPDVVPWGHFTNIEGDAPAGLTNTTIDATLGTGSLANYGGTFFADLGTLAVLDKVQFVGSAVMSATVDFSFGVYITENGGAPIPLSTGLGGIPGYAAPGGGRNIPVSIGFHRNIATAGNAKIYFKGNVVSASTATLVVSGYSINVFRP